MTTLGSWDLLGFFGLGLIGSAPSALLFVLPAIAVYFLAKRSGPAAGALSALTGLVLLSVVLVLSLAPMPKWWTVQWPGATSAYLPTGGRPEAEFLPPASIGPPAEWVSLNDFAMEDRTAPSLPGVPIVPPTKTEEPSEEASHSWNLDWAYGLRLIGILLVVGWCLALVRFALGLRAVKRYRDNSLEITDSCAIDLTEPIARQLGFPGPIRLRKSADFGAAATVGWFHPVILLPANWETWSREELQVVLAHEIGHIARRDYPAWLLAQFSLALHFYHPLAYWLLNRLRRDQELAADLLGSELCGGREKYLITLSQLVLRQTTRPAPLLSRPMFSARGTFLWRMRMLHARKLPVSARLKRLSVSLLVLLSIAIGLASAGVGISFGKTAPQGPQNAPSGTAGVAGEGGILKGRVTAADSGKPVEGAVVRVHVDGVPGFPRWLELLSDKDGNYSHDLPLGHSSLFGVIPPPGYYSERNKTYDDIVATKKGEIIVRDFSLQSGSPWKIELAGYTRSKGKPPAISATFDRKTVLGSQPGQMLLVYANAQGDATLTLPQVGGDCKIHCTELEPSHRFEIPSVDLKMERGFDPNAIQGDPEANAKDRSIRLKDTAGKIATVTGADVINRDGHAIVRFQCKAIPKSAGFKVRGIVQTEKGDPISGAKVTAVFISNTAGSMTELVAYSGEKGEFIIPEVLLNASFFKEDQRIKLAVVKSGFDGAESKQISLLDIKKSGIADFGIVKLNSGKILRGKIVDEKGNSIQGAVVRCSNSDFAHSHLTCRSGIDGRFQIPDLSYGKMKLHVIYGDLAENEECDFDEDTGEWTIAIRPYKVAANPSPFLPRPEDLAILFSLRPFLPFW